MDRFDLDPRLRVPCITLGTGIFGFLRGARLGFQTTSDRFLVENSHRLPKTKGGWYFYHKRKNWICLKEAVHQGVKTSIKFGALVGAFFATEALLDYGRGQIDFINTVITTVTFGAAYSQWYCLNSQATKQVLKKGLILGIVGGLTQDVLRKLRNGDVWYLRRFNLQGLQPV